MIRSGRGGVIPATAETDRPAPEEFTAVRVSERPAFCVTASWQRLRNRENTVATYIDVEEAKQRTGLRLVVAPGIPDPWGEAIKGNDRTVQPNEAGGCTRRLVGASPITIRPLNDSITR